MESYNDPYSIGLYSLISPIEQQSNNPDYLIFETKEDYELVSNLPETDLQRFCSDYRMFPYCVSYNDDAFSLCLSEGLIKTYPIDKTIQYVKKYLPIGRNLIFKSVSNNIERIIVIVANIGENINEVIHALNVCGYYLVYPKGNYLQKLKKNEVVRLQFEPKFTENKSKEILTFGDYAYHWTQPKYMNKINRIGLIPKSTNNTFDYPERIHLVKQTATQNEILKLGRLLAISINADKVIDNIPFEQELILLKVDLKKIRKGTAFFDDPSYLYGIYTMDNIPPEAIVNNWSTTFKIDPDNE